MRYAMSGSALVHAAIFGMALLGFAWPEPEDAPPPGAVTVDIVATVSVSTNQSSTLEAAAVQNQVSAGAEPVSSQTSEPVEPETLQPAQSPVSPPLVEPLAPRSAPIDTLAVPATQVEAPAIVPLASLTVAASETVPTQKLLPSVVEPISVDEVSPAPVPRTLSFARPSAPTQRQQVQPKPPVVQASPAGNGGKNNADSAASKAGAGQAGAGGGGTADIARWESQVRRALANARRYPRAANGAAGDVTVRFVVSASGALSNLSIIASSGNQLLDQAALETVTRAAPFPPIPHEADIASKTVQLPLGFVR